MFKSDGFILPVMLILMLILSLLSLSLFEAEQKHLAIFAMIQHTVQDSPNFPSQRDDSFTLRATDAKTQTFYWQKEIQNFRLTLRCNKDNQCEISGLHRVL